ncbi:hypothetical protein AVEN_9066-1, partial [Araneus ventricosus]
MNNWQTWQQQEREAAVVNTCPTRNLRVSDDRTSCSKGLFGKISSSPPQAKSRPPTEQLTGL